jgi:hypothetical protein
VLTPAIEYNNMAGEIYIITQARQGLPQRAVLTVFISAPQQSKDIPLADLKLHDPLLEMPFESVWMPTLQALMVRTRIIVIITTSIAALTRHI